MHAGQLVTVLALLCSAFGLTAALEAAFVTGQVRVLWEQTPAVSTAWSAGTAAVLLAATAIVFAGAVLLDRRHAVGRWLVIAGGVAMLVAGIGGPSPSGPCRSRTPTPGSSPRPAGRIWRWSPARCSPAGWLRLSVPATRPGLLRGRGR